MADVNPVGIKVEGLTQVVKALTELGFETEDLRRAFGRISAEALPVYRGFTPRRTGALQADYRASRTRNRAALAVGRARVPYARPIQWGWPARNIAPAHFVQKGDRVMERRAVPILEEEINKIIQLKGLRQ